MEQQQQQEPTAAGGAMGAAPAAGAATEAGAAVGSKRVLTDSQRGNLAKKQCKDCGKDMPCASKSCKECNAVQQRKSELELLALQAPMQPYLPGQGEVPQLQDSTQALANVRKCFEKPAFLKLVSSGGGGSHTSFLSVTRTEHIACLTAMLVPLVLGVYCCLIACCCMLACQGWRAC